MDCRYSEKFVSRVPTLFVAAKLRSPKPNHLQAKKCTPPESWLEVRLEMHTWIKERLNGVVYVCKKRVQSTCILPASWYPSSFSTVMCGQRNDRISAGNERVRLPPRIHSRRKRPATSSRACTPCSTGSHTIMITSSQHHENISITQHHERLREKWAEDRGAAFGERERQKDKSNLC